MLNPKRKTLILRLNLAFALVVGLFVVWAYLKEPSEPGSAVFLGFSPFRLILLLSVLFLLLAILVSLLSLFGNPRRVHSIEQQFVSVANRKGILWLSFLGVAAVYLLLSLSDHHLGPLASYRERLVPILIWIAILSIQLGLLPVLLRGIQPGILSEQQGILFPTLVVLVSFGILLLIVSLTRIGLTPDKVYWQELGVPVLLHQVLLATFMGVLFYLFIESTPLESSNRLDWVVFLGLWGITCLLWLSQPARLTHFSLEPTPPNYQSYPFSDALLYDHTAREFLIGKPIPSDFWTKPLYSFFLAILHLVAGGDYVFLITLQVIFLALIPSFSYLLMARLDSRSAGLILALLLIMRERNALALSNVIEVSHVKLLLSDVFAMGFMVLLLWLFFHWLEKPEQRRVALFALGGIFSLLVLTRGHPILLLPLVLCAVFLVPFPQFYMRWQATALALLGFAIPLIPWLWRNYEYTGRPVFQYPVSPYSAQMSKAYSFDPSVFDPENLPPKYSGESDFAYYDRLQGQAFQFVLEHPDEVARFTSAHYFHNLIFSYLYLPYSFRIEDIKEYVKIEPFWGDWRGNLSLQGTVLLIINLGLIALGFGRLWKKYRLLGLVPLLFGIGYNLSVSVGRLSGWRFILPADWITLIYYVAGIMQCYEILRSFMNQKTKPSSYNPESWNPVQPLQPAFFVSGILPFLLIGIAVTNGQELFSHKYPEKSTLQLKEEYSRTTREIPSAIPSDRLDEFLKTEGAIIVYGQALNPSFRAAANEELNGTWPVFYFWPSYKPRPFSRVIFNVAGPRSVGVVLPIKSPPASFPDGASVIVIGCKMEAGDINALSVLVVDKMPLLYQNELEALGSPTCTELESE